MKRIPFLFSLMMFSIIGYAQEVNYSLGASADNVDCYYAITKCNGNTVVLLRFDNKNTTPITISWKERFTTGQQPDKSPGYRDNRVTLPPGVSGVTECTDVQQKAFIIGTADVHPAFPAEITGFEFTDISVRAK